jgi:hypothetical protein
VLYLDCEAMIVKTNTQAWPSHQGRLGHPRLAAQQANSEAVERERQRAVELQVARAELERGRIAIADELAQAFRF